MADEADQSVVKAQFDAMIAASRNSKGKISTVQQRMDQLNRLEKMQVDHREEICQAIFEDYGGTRSIGTNAMNDILTGLNTCRQVKAKLAQWAQDEIYDCEFPLNMLGSGRCSYQPLGVVLIVSPWNFPWHLPASGLADAFGGGNRVVLKPSEMTPKTSALLKTLLAKYFTEDEVYVVLGGAKTAAYVCSLPFDHILYTGSSMVGKLVAQAAAPNLTPCTLELGGKSPVVVCPDMNLKEAANCIITDKLNCGGQICVAPDYVLVPKGKGQEFADVCIANVREHWGSMAQHAEYVGIINRRHYDRLQGLVSDAIAKGAKVLDLDADPASFDPNTTLRFPPKLILGVTDEMDVATEEVFGPLLPIIEYEDLDAAIQYVNDRPRPLALYCFTHSKKNKQAVVSKTTSGGVTVNGCAWHCVPQTMPFGGVGNSGMGAYHGHEGFRTFTHKKAIFEANSCRKEFGPISTQPAEFLITVDPQTKLAALKSIMPAVSMLALAGYLYTNRVPAKSALVTTLKALLGVLESDTSQ